MAQKIQAPPPAAYWDVLALLRVISNPEDHLARLQELEAVRAELVERAECEESWERQQALEADAKGKLGEATKLLDGARADAVRIRKEAEGDALVQRDSLRLSREEWAKSRAKEQDDLAGRAKALEERERIAREQLETAKTTLSRGQYLMSEATKLAEEYKAKVAALKGIVHQ